MIAKGTTSYWAFKERSTLPLRSKSKMPSDGKSCYGIRISAISILWLFFPFLKSFAFFLTLCIMCLTRRQPAENRDTARAMFDRIHQAYKVLGDPRQRELYHRAEEG